ncbi:MAG: glutamine amidotransferase [Planctomycetota bacterium]|nr:glutamine amidotransferase [Planctomycetota bacterium]
MLDDLPIQFEQPGWLILLALLLPIWFISFLHAAHFSAARRFTSLAFRTVVVLLLTMALARPTLVKRGDAITVTVISDVSQSIPLPERVRAASLVQSLIAGRSNPDDQLAAVSLAANARPSAKPDPDTIVDLDAYDGETDATDLAAGVEQALSLIPADTANRLLLISDGNETRGSVLEVAEIARANRIPIDVIPIRYASDNEVLVDQVKVPSRARLGQTVDLKVFLRSQKATSGSLTVSQNGAPLVLDPEQGSTSVNIELPAGPTVLSFPVSLERGGAHQFEAQFEPANPESDGLLENNRGNGVTFVSGEGRILFVEGSPGAATSLRTALLQGGIQSDLLPPDALDQGTALLNGYDAIILCNLPRWAVSNTADTALHSYVHDLGGGLMMVGGDQSFGAGGWIDSQTAEVLPVRLDPPQQRQMVRGALALIIHSTEMPRANYWAQQTAIAAIEALTSLDYIGIITYNYNATGKSINGASWALPMQEAGDKARAIAATKSMVVGDMPDFSASLELAYEGLEPLRAGQKHMVIISDGDPAAPSSALLNKFVEAKISITTIMYAGHGTYLHRQAMRAIAGMTGGTFYNEPPPSDLPKIFTKEATVVSRSLINEGTYDPQVRSSLSGPVKGIDSVPPIRGFVLTVDRDEGRAQTPIVVQGAESQDPLLAYWNYGLGKSLAFTSDLSGRWCADWIAWAGFQRMWEQSVRWLMRPASPANVLLRTRIEGETAIVEVDATNEDSGFINFLQTDSRVLDPDGVVQPLELEQVGPGRYRGEFQTGAAGAYLVNVGFPTVSASGEAQLRSVQGAVSLPYSKEFRSVQDNSALLRTIADRTGGRVIELDANPESIDLFEKASIEVPLAPRRIWDLIAIIAVVLFIIDVAVRRLTIDSRAARAAMSRSIAASTGARSSEASVSAWKRARAQSRRGRRRDRSDSSPAPSGGSTSEATRSEGSATSFDVDSELSGSSASGSDSSPSPSSRAVDARESEEAEEGSLARLKRAKRRALDGDPPE